MDKLAVMRDSAAGDVGISWGCRVMRRCWVQREVPGSEKMELGSRATVS